MRVTSFDVAKAAGVSQPTVSRALRGDPSVSAATRDRIRQVAEALEYVPSERGRNLSTSSTQRVAMVVDLDNPLWPLLVRRLHDTLEAAGLHLTLDAGHGDAGAMAAQLLGGGVDGVIVSTVALDSPVPEEFARRGVPLVLLNRVTEGAQPDSSTADDRSGGALAAELLLEAGHRDIGALFGPPDTSTGRGRERGFREALDHAGVPLRADWIRHGPFDYGYGRTAIVELTAAGEHPSAVFCANDIIAIGAMDMAGDRGISVPGDLALVGFDDLDQASWSSFDLTTIAVPFDAMVDCAVELLVDRIGGYEGPGRPVVHPVTQVRRGSHLRGAVR